MAIVGNGNKVTILCHCNGGDAIRDATSFSYEYFTHKLRRSFVHPQCYEKITEGDTLVGTFLHKRKGLLRVRYSYVKAVLC